MVEEILHILLVGATILSASTESPTKRVLGYPNRLIQNGIKRQIPFGLAGRRTLVLQIRSDGPVPIVFKRPNRQQLFSSHVRPVKFSVSPHFAFKSSPLGKQPRKPTAMMKFKYTKPKPHGEYVYEKPFSPAPELNKPQVDNSVHLANAQFGPIHTIPAPNLGIQTNHLHPYEHPILTSRPNVQYQHQLHQHYQVTEEPTNDQTIVDPHSGQQKYFAPDPDPSLPAPRVPISLDPYSIPSNGQPLPEDVQTNLLSSTSPGVQSHQFLHFINPVTQQQYAGTYGLPIVNQPQLQQYILQQTASAQQMPLAVYNPTYLVTQSNSLYNQHQQQLFKPNPNYLESLKHNYPGADLTQEVASEGQILQAGKDGEDYNILHETGTHDSPQYAALVGNPPTGYSSASNLVDQHVVHPEQQQGSESGYVDSTGLQSGFVVSNYYGNHQEPTSYQEQIDLSQAQHDNQLKLQQAQYDLQQEEFFGRNSHQYSDQANDQSSANSAFEEHQRLVQQHLGGSPLRIFVPDEEYQSDNGIQKRSDDFSEEDREEEQNNAPEQTVDGKRD